MLGAISQIRAGVILAYPNCSPRVNFCQWTSPSAMSQISTRRDGVIELLQICNTFMARQGEARAAPGADSPGARSDPKTPRCDEDPPKLRQRGVPAVLWGRRTAQGRGKYAALGRCCSPCSGCRSTSSRSSSLFPSLAHRRLSRSVR